MKLGDDSCDGVLVDRCYRAGADPGTEMTVECGPVEGARSRPQVGLQAEPLVRDFRECPAGARSRSAVTDLRLRTSETGVCQVTADRLPADATVFVGVLDLQASGGRALVDPALDPDTTRQAIPRARTHPRPGRNG